MSSAPASRAVPSLKATFGPQGNRYDSPEGRVTKGEHFAFFRKEQTLHLCDPSLGASDPVPGFPEVALGEGPWAAQEAGSLGRCLIEYAFRFHVKP